VARSVSAKALRQALTLEVEVMAKDNPEFEKKFCPVADIPKLTNQKFIKAFWFLHSSKK
jgi:hypothetical protein